MLQKLKLNKNFNNAYNTHTNNIEINNPYNNTSDSLIKNQQKFSKTSLNLLSSLRSKKNEDKKSYISLIPELNVAFDVFKKINYQNLSYDVHKIFNNDKEYFDMLKIKIEEMKSSVKFEIEEKGFLSKKFKEKNNKFNLLLNSIIIEFEFSNGGFKDPLILNLPICLLPLFYFNHPENIKYLFMSLIEFDEKFEKISFDFQKMYNYVIFSDKYDTLKLNEIEYSKGGFNINVYNFKWITPVYNFEVSIK